MSENSYKNLADYYQPPIEDDSDGDLVDDRQRWDTWPDEASSKLDHSMGVSTSRRGAISGAVAAVVVGATGATTWGLEKYNNSKGTGAEPVVEALPTVDTPDINMSAIEVVNYPHAFEDENAREVAQKHSITTGSLIEAHYELADTLDGFMDDELLPIFHPMVYDHKDVLYSMAKKSGIPVNYIAFLASIESGGDPEADSGLAVGLFQLNQDYYAKGATKEEWSDPSNIEDEAIAAMQESLEDAREYLGLSESDMSPDVFIRAAAIYNAGKTNGSKEYEDLYDETQHYMHHASRFIQVAQVANELRESGYTNIDIVESLRSPSVDARAYALQYSGLSAREALAYLENDPLEEPSNDTEKMLHDLCVGYGDIYTMPLNPFLRVHTGINAGFVLAGNYEANSKVENYLNIDTSRP